MADTAASVTGTENESDRAVNPDVQVVEDGRAFDILAFLALFLASMQDFAQNPQTRTLADTFLDARLLSLATGGGSGGSFAVSVVNTEDMERLQDTKRETDITSVLPPLLALRVPKVSLGAEKQQKQRILTAMAKEIEVLTNEEIRRSDNIVKLLGACWSYANPERDILLPVLVYEAAPLGDLDAFLSSHENLPLGHQLQLCVDIAHGVERLHHVGVVHCDLKPKNIIVFPTQDPKRPFIAKVADFGCAIMMGDVEESIPPPPGTRFWNPPEQLDGSLVDKDKLVRIDLFTLGLVILAILTSNQSTRALTYLQQRSTAHVTTRDGGMSFDYFKRWGSLSISALMILERFANLTVTQRSSVKANVFWQLIPPELLDDENAMDYAEHWNKQVGSILFQALQGDIDERDLTARDMVSVLEAVLVSVEIWGQRDHVRVDLHENINASGTTVPLTFILEHESQEKLQSLIHHVVEDRNTNRRIAVQHDWILNRNPHTDLSYVLPRMMAVNHIEEWEDLIFGPDERGEQPWMAVHKRSQAVVKLTNYLGNMSLMPGPLLKYVMRVLDGVAYDSRENRVRRSDAAYELALSIVAFVIDESSEDGDATQVSRVLSLLQIALENGHKECKWVIGWMFETFDHVYPAERIEWLAEGMLAGSQIAARRLRTQSREQYDRIRVLIQSEYQGIGEGWQIKPEYMQEDPVFYPGNPIPKSYQLILAASSGSLPRLIRLLDDNVDIDSVDGMLETPLVAACRAGHTHIVEYLLEHGAMASKLSKEAISPLHFLSSFENDAIPYIALLLCTAGCPLETHSTGHSNLNNGHTGSDRLYGLVDGTPLLWAVAANNLIAVRTLVGLGADPFDRAATAASVPYSPIGYASAMHQYDVLQELLSSGSTSEICTLLNTTSTSTVTGSLRGPALGPASAYSGGLVFYRMQLHGQEHRKQCRKTIALLLSAGADPASIDSSNQPALHYAGIHGQPYALQALLDLTGKIEKSNIRLWTNILIGAVHNDCRGSFRELLKMDIETNEKYSWPIIIGTIAEQQHSLYYVTELITHHKKLCPGNADYTVAFELALQGGSFDCAKAILGQADRCDIINRRFEGDEDVQSQRESMTVLGRLMRQALIYVSQLPAVRSFLELTGGPENLFENVWDLEHGKYNALQVAVQYAPHSRTKTLTNGLLELILQYYKDPIRHLGAVHSDTNRSLLHIAIRHGNASAVEILLNYGGIDLGQRDNEFHTAFDRALNRLQDSWRDKELQYWEVSEDQLEKAREKWEHDSRVMIRAMEAKGASKYSTYSHVFKKISKDQVRRWIIYPDDGRIEVTNFNTATFESGDLTGKVASLEVGRCSYLAMFADPEIAAKITGGKPLDITQLLEQTKLVDA